MTAATRRTAILATACLVAAPLAAMAQGAPSFPARPVRIVVPTPAGGPSDTAARLVAQQLAAAWGVAVNVENRAGASGALAVQAVNAAPADGHTLLWAQGSMAGLPFVLKVPPYRHMNELAPVSNVVQFGYGMFVANDVPARSFAELVAYGRANPGKLNFGTGTLGEFMVGVHVLDALGVKATRVPYRGGVQLMPDLVAGQLQMNFGPLLSGMPHVKAGRLRMMATLLPQRSPLMPEVPTLAELGVAPGNLPSWNALFAPGPTPREVTEKIAAAVAAAVRNPAVRGPLEQQGADTIGSTPQQLAQAVEAATVAWRSFVQDHQIPLE